MEIRLGDKIFLIISGIMMAIHISGIMMTLNHQIDYNIDSGMFFTSLMVIVGIPYVIYRTITHLKERKVAVHPN